VGAAAAAWLAGRPARLERLGSADPFTASWAAGEPPVERPAAAAIRAAGRGRFREIYRQALDGWRPTLAALAAQALLRGVLDRPDDLYFLPFELLGDLTVEERPAWLAASVLRNRAEYFGLVQSASPAERAAWEAAPVRPLP
jgi:hypothetical protein